MKGFGFSLISGPQTSVLAYRGTGWRTTVVQDYESTPTLFYNAVCQNAKSEWRYWLKITSGMMPTADMSTRFTARLARR